MERRNQLSEEQRIQKKPERRVKNEVSFGEYSK
jgi:hypothetical protein